MKFKLTRLKPIALVGFAVFTSMIVVGTVIGITNESTIKDTYEVTKVIDGDTIEVEINGKTEKVRLIGVDTPETKDPRKPVQCFGKEASVFTKTLLLGKRVELRSDPSQDEIDKYDRLLRYVFLEDGTNFNQKLITEGFAHEYTYKTAYQYQDEFKKAETYAMTQGVGLWSPQTCNGTDEEQETIPLEINDPLLEYLENGSQVTVPNSSLSPTNSSQDENDNCDPGYNPCVPNYPPDVNCDDVGYPVEVTGSDPHGLDRDEDGYGCESY